MYGIRVYKNIDSNKIIGIRVVEENTLRYNDFTIKELKEFMTRNPNLIVNIELGSDGLPRLVNYMQNKKKKYYLQTFENNMIINHYCIITGFQYGTLQFLADTSDDNIVAGSGLTLSDLSNRLRISNMYELKLYNAEIEKVDNHPYMKVYDANGIHQIEIGKPKIVNNVFDANYKAKINEVTHEGVSVKSLENTIKEYKSIIPEGVSHIDRFKGGVNILKLPFSLKSLGEGCFQDLDDLLEIIFNESLKVIPKNCCRNTTLKGLVLPGNIESIEESAFEDCYDMKGTLVTKANYIGRRAFCGTRLSIVHLIGTEIIDIEAFSYNSKLYKVKLEEGLKKIKGGAFRFCSSIEDISFPESLETIGQYAFDGCKKLKKVYLYRATKVHKDAFPKSTKITYYD